MDASLVVKWVLWEPDTPAALALRAQWEEEARACVAPAFFWAEIGSVFRKRAERGLMDDAAARDCFAIVLDMRVELLPVPWLRAYDIAASLGQLHLYDACYLAVAESLDIEFWTGDEALFNNASSVFPWIHLL